MSKHIITSISLLSLIGVIFVFNATDNLIFNKANAQTSESEESAAKNLSLRIHPVPNSFRESYISILSYFITSNDEILYQRSAQPDILDTTSSKLDEEIDHQDNNVKPIDYVQYDPEKNIVIVLATPEEHDKIKSFIDQLSDSKKTSTPVMYRMALVERSVHPKLKDYPYEFWIEGKAWKHGRTDSKYPKWFTDRNDKFPNVIFSEIDIDREDGHTEFEVRGFARNKEDAAHITKSVQKAHDTDSDTNIIKHDFMKESYENLNNVLGDIFPDSKLDKIIHSLQHTEVYQVEAEAIMACESSIPGFYRTALGDGYHVEIKNINGIEPNGNYGIQIHVYHKKSENDLPFDEKNLHLATSLITEFGQINMLGIRHRDTRYVLLFSMEEAK